MDSEQRIWWEKRWNYGIDDRHKFSFDYFEHDEAHKYFKHPLNLDVWYCTKCKDWEMVREVGRILRCEQCGGNCGQLASRWLREH
jgi:hypothetical protein